MELDWTLNDVAITAGGDISITQQWPLDLDNGLFQYVESTLTISNFETGDTGTYKSSGSTDFNGATIDVEGSGTIVDLSNLFMTAGFAEAGDAVTLYCMYGGTGTGTTFSFQVKNDDGDWENVSGSTITQTTLSGASLTAAKTATGKSSASQGSMLVISSISSSDVGFYRVTMLDSLGSTTESMERSIQLLTSSIPVSKMLIETGESAYITCTFTGPYTPDVTLKVFDDDTSAFVEDTSAYWNSATKSTSMVNSMTTKTTTTVFTKVITTNAPYICSAVFYDVSYPEITATVPSDQVEILTASITLSTSEPTLTLYEGVSFTFICQYSFETAATIALSPTPDETASHEITDSDSGVTSGYVAGEMGVLEMSSFKGPYNCKLDIDGYSLEKELTLVILEIPDVPSIEALSVQDQDYDWLVCTFSTDLPLASISWFTYVDDEETYYTTYRLATIMTPSYEVISFLTHLEWQ